MIKIKLKFWFYMNYWWLLSLIFIIILFFIISTCKNIDDFKFIIAILGTLLSIFYFIQKQRLEEMKLFREIFAECNSRYDQLNEKLNSIIEIPSNETLNKEQTTTLMDYFNLCGEEYLYYIQGYLYPEVWNAWLNGMKFFFKNQHVTSLWKTEKESNSYYGLSL